MIKRTYATCSSRRCGVDSQATTIVCTRLDEQSLQNWTVLRMSLTSDCLATQVARGAIVKMDSGDYEIKNLDVFSCGEVNKCFMSVLQEMQSYNRSLSPNTESASSAQVFYDGTKLVDLDAYGSFQPAIVATPAKRSKTTTPRKLPVNASS